jgi:tetratricopeptide (TPR) repeat protein
MVLQPFHLVAILALLFLLPRLRREPGVRLLLGIAVVIPAACLVPLLAMKLGGLITPWMVYRLAWPLTLAAALALGWSISILLDWRRWPRLSAVALAALLVVLAARGIPTYWGAITLLREGRDTLASNSCFQLGPILRPFADLVSSSEVPAELPKPDPNLLAGDAPSGVTVLANSVIDQCLAGYAPYANVMEFRKNNVARFYPLEQVESAWQRLSDALYFENAEFVDDRLIQTIERWGIGYLIVSQDETLDTQLRHLAGLFQPVTSAVRHTIYRVNYPLPDLPIIAANALLTAGEPEQAVSSYQALLQSGDDDTRFLAALGLGRAYLDSGQLELAISAWKQATAWPEALPWGNLGEALMLQGEPALATDAFRQAAAVRPDSSTCQARLGDACVLAGDLPCAEAAYRAAIVDVAPESSVFYQQLGDRWAASNVFDQALAAYQHANSILFSRDGLAKLGQAYIDLRRWSEAEAALRGIEAIDGWEEMGHRLLGGLYQMRNQFDAA